MKSYSLIISYAFFSRLYVSVPSDTIFYDFLIRSTKPRSKITHIILIIYFHNYIILFKISRVYVIYTLDSIAQVLKRTIGLHILINLNHFLLLTHMVQNIMSRITKLITNCYPTWFVTPHTLL